MSVKWGVIGCGGIADRRTIPEGILPAKNAELVAVMDVNEEKLKGVSQKYNNVRSYLTEEELVNDKEVQAVYIATPVYLHPKQVALAARAGKHILCEKAMALTIKDCQEMIDVCKQNKVKLGIGLMMRYHAYHIKAKEMVEQGLLGKITFCRAQLSCWYPDIEGAWRQDPESGGGGSLIDMGSHCIDVLEVIIGSKVNQVSCFTAALVHSYPVEDTSVAILGFEDGAQGVVDSCFSIPDASSKNRLEMYGTKGSILAEGTIGQMPGGEMWAYLEKEAKGYDAGQGRETDSVQEEIKPVPVNMYQGEVEDFSKCVEEDSTPSVTGEDGLWTQRVVLACYESARTGQAVKVKA